MFPGVVHVNFSFDNEECSAKSLQFKLSQKFDKTENDLEMMQVILLNLGCLSTL